MAQQPVYEIGRSFDSDLIGVEDLRDGDVAINRNGSAVIVRVRCYSDPQDADHDHRIVVINKRREFDGHDMIVQRDSGKVVIIKRSAAPTVAKFLEESWSNASAESTTKTERRRKLWPFSRKV